MKKVTLAFPDHHSLWSFKSLSNAINVTVCPRKNTMTALFTDEEINTAVLKFNALLIQPAITTLNSSGKKAIEQSAVSFRNKLLQLLTSGFQPAIRG